LRGGRGSVRKRRGKVGEMVLVPVLLLGGGERCRIDIGGG